MKGILKLIIGSYISYLSCYHANAVIVQVGNLGTQSFTTDITPYKSYFEDGRSQYLVLASEIIAGGGSAGTILSLSYFVSYPQSYLLNGFTIKKRRH